jgi:hypothetical protein
MRKEIMGAIKRDNGQIFSYFLALEEKRKCGYTIFATISNMKQTSKDGVIAVGRIIDINLLKKMEVNQQSRVS